MLRTLAVSGACALAVVLMAGGTAVSGTDTGDTTSRSKGRNCFYINDIDRYYPIDDRTLEISDHRGNSFKLELTGACFGLEGSLRLGFRSKGSSRVCGPMDAEVIYHDSASGRMRRCTIVSISRIESDDKDTAQTPAAPVAARRAG